MGTTEQEKRRYIEDFQYISSQLDALSNTVGRIAESFAAENENSGVAESFATIRHSINGIRMEIDLKVGDIK